MGEKNTTNRVYLIIAIVGFMASGFGGYYGGQLNTASEIAELKITDAGRNEKIANLKESDDKLMKQLEKMTEALNETTKTLNILLVHYAATTGDPVR